MGRPLPGPAAAVYNNQLYTMVRGMDNGIYVKTGLGSGWAKVDGTTLTNPSLANYNGQLYSFICGTDNQLYFNTYNGSWRSWNRVKDRNNRYLSVSNAGDAFQFRKELFLVSRNGSNSLYNIMNCKGNWDKWSKVKRESYSDPALAVFQDGVFLAIRGTDDKIYLGNHLF